MEATQTSLQQRELTLLKILPPVRPTQHLARTRCLTLLQPASILLLGLERWILIREIIIRPSALLRFCSIAAQTTLPLELPHWNLTILAGTIRPTERSLSLATPLATSTRPSVVLRS